MAALPVLSRGEPPPLRSWVVVVFPELGDVPLSELWNKMEHKAAMGAASLDPNVHIF